MKGRSLSKKTTYSSLSNLETENISDDNDDTRTLTSRHSIHSLSKRSKSNKSHKSRSHKSKSGKSRSSKKHHRSEQKEQSRSDRKSDDNASRSSKTTSIKSLSVKTFYRNRRSRNRNQQAQDPYGGQRPLSGQKSKSSKNQSENSLIDASGNWRCDQCSYFPNTRYDPHCYKCGAMKDDPQHMMVQQLKNKPRKRTVSSTGTTSSSPILAPGSVPQHSSNLSHQIIHSSDNTTTDNTTTTDDETRETMNSSSSSDTDSSSDDDSDSSTDMTSKQTISNVKAIVVEDNRSKTSKTSKSNSRHAIGQPMDYDEDLDIISGEIALPQKKRKSFDGDENGDNDDDEEDPNGGRQSVVGGIPNNNADGDDEDEDDDDDDDDDSTHSSDGDVITEMPHSHLRRRRSSTSAKFNNFIDKFSWNNGHNGTKMKKQPKAREWQTFQFYLGFKRFVLAILYFIVALEEVFVLVYIKWWLPLPLILCITYLLLISCDFNKKCGGSFNKIKHDHRIRTLILIASANVYDYRDLLDRDMIYNHLMWIFFSFSIVSMVFIDIIIVHDDDTINDKYRVETFKLAVVKDEEYVLNNQCLWYSVPRKDWGTIDKKLKKKHSKRNKYNQDSYSLDGVHSSDNTKQNSNNTKSFFVRIGLGKDNDDSNSKNHNGHHHKTVSDEEDEDEEEEDDDDDTNEDDGDSTSFDRDSSDVDDDDDDDDHERVRKVGNKNMKNRSHINTDNEFDDDRQSMHSMTNIINNNRDGKISRCCTAPFSILQWILTFTFFISLQLCVVFAIFETLEIEKHDISVPPPQ